MSAAPVKRKLAAILAADAVGYSRLMAADEEGTMRILGAHRAMIDGIIELQEGRIVNTAGDSVIAEFDSPVQAVRCAVEIQDALRTRNDALPEDKRLMFRIGVNLGDVMVKGDDLLGDGVNVAARLESVATPGGICVSSSVYDQIAGKLDLSFVDVGHQALKNIDRPVRVYRIDRNGRIGTKSSRRSSPAARWLLGFAVLAALAFGAWKFVLEPMQDAARRADAATAAEAAKAVEASRMRSEAAERERAEEARQRNEAAQREQAAAEQRRIKAEAALAEQLAAAAAAQRRAEAQASAAADAKRALEAQRAAEAQARAKADVARLRAEAEEAKRRAAAELSAATAARLEAEAKAAAPAIPAAPSLKEGQWTAEISCPQHQASPPRIITTPVFVEDDAFLVKEGGRDQPGSLRLRGTLNADASVSFLGSGVSGRRSGARHYPAAFTARLAGARYEGSGRLGPRECELTLSRAP
jgi:class 3 adenylate cyclase